MQRNSLMLLTQMFAFKGLKEKNKVIFKPIFKNKINEVPTEHMKSIQTEQASENSLLEGKIQELWLKLQILTT